ncbi:cysteine desulfurase family protein [Amorphus coralli]|uniref:cysteine desulfurase family protein n=1 Tax=Amorphus coralli TaxID=340680 RepID=UPI00036ADDCC|nr:cysteine desulfurase family protein [Amorphus coralli]
MATTAKSRVFFDWNAGAPLSAAARDAVVDALDLVGNPSSVHSEGRAARALIESARSAIAALCGADSAGVTFTSGGTEANQTALSPDMEIAGRPLRFARLLVSAVEHPSVMAGGRFGPGAVETIPVDFDGVVDLAALERMLGEVEGPALVSVMAANNETGVIQPVAEAAAIVHAAGGVLHVDAVQVAGRLPMSIETLGCDVLTLSGHKIGGPRGVGAVVRRAGLRIPPLITGGGQEARARAGTENPPAIAGFGAAAREAVEKLADQSRISGLRDWFERDLMLISPGVTVFGASAARLPNTSAFALEGVSAETAVIALDLAGVAVSSGSACSSGKVSASHVLDAMGVPFDLAAGAIRVSLGPTTSEADVERLLSVWQSVSHRFARRPGDPASHFDRLRQPAGLEPAVDGETDASSAGNDRPGSVDRHRQVQVRLRHGHRVRQGA